MYIRWSGNQTLTVSQYVFWLYVCSSYIKLSNWESKLDIQSKETYRESASHTNSDSESVWVREEGKTDTYTEIEGGNRECRSKKCGVSRVNWR